MRILWLCNIMLPMIAEALGKEASNKEGWLTGLADKLLEHSEKEDITLGVCFPVGKDSAPISGKVGDLQYFGFPEDTVRPENYDANLEEYLAEIVEDFNPDVVHVFGTEFPHTLAMTRCVKEKERLLLGIQGVCFAIAEAYMADLPKKIQNRSLFRDFVKQDNIRQQQEKFVKRGAMEQESLRNALHVTGRTDWDKEKVLSVNPNLTYHFMNETLRMPFYKNRWQIKECEPYSIFLSQGNYPLKGLHYVLEAMPLICEKYPAAKLYVAGDKITAYESIKEKIKIGSYGKYCLSLVRKYHLQEKVVFLGKLGSEEMCNRYLHSHVLLMASSMENSSNSLGEAMLLGMPVVSSEVGGIPGMLTHEKEGLLYPTGNIRALAEAVCRIFGEEEVACVLGERARERALKTHDAETNFNRLLEIYRELAAGQ